MTVTLQDIADSTGVTATTVSYVLNGRFDHVSEETQAKVLQEVQRVGYRPNSSARAVRNGRHGTVALVMSPEPHRSALPADLLIGITGELAKHHLHLLVDYVADEQLTSETTLPRLLRERSCDGMFLNYFAHIPGKLEELTERFRLPVIWINARRAYDSVYPDDSGAAKALTDRLIAEGHHRILYADCAYNKAIRAGEQHFSKPARLEGYMAAMRQAGLPSRTVFDADTEGLSFAAGMEAFMRDVRVVFETPQPPTAVVSYGREGGVIREVLASLRRQDVSVVSFGARTDLVRALTRGMALPYQAMAKTAVEMLTKKMTAPSRRIKAVPMPFESVWDLED